ncbi:MAG: GtrA-like protein [Marmoricola sp.]|nr:GtrA-like protein [Marmoricola sp.]
MGQRWQRALYEGAKFLTVGGIATLVSFVFFNGLVHGYFGGPGPMHDDPLVAFVIANTIGMVVSYRGSRSWAFRNREAVGAAGGRVRFFVINIVSMVIPLGCLSFSRYVLGLSDPVADNVAANVVGLVLGTLARFWALKQFIFLTPERIERRQLLAEQRSA